MSDLLLDLTGSVARVTLNRPDRRNAVTAKMWVEMADLFARLAGDRAVRALVLTGAGDHFCGGADIGEFSELRSSAEDGLEYERDADRCVEALMAMPQPTLAAVRGFCLGGGCALAMACDFRLAAPTARFGIPAARLGVVYGPLHSRNLLALVGATRAKDLLFSARRFDAGEAARLGFADLVNGDVLTAAERLALQFADNAPLSLAGAKLIVNALAHGQAAEQTEAIHSVLRQSLESADYREGIRAFLEKRRPVFTGH